ALQGDGVVFDGAAAAEHLAQLLAEALERVYLEVEVRDQRGGLAAAAFALDADHGAAGHRVCCGPGVVVLRLDCGCWCWRATTPQRRERIVEWLVGAIAGSVDLLVSSLLAHVPVCTTGRAARR